MKKSEIKFNVDLDENMLPKKISWEAEGISEKKEAAAIMISIWDKHENNTLRLDLWREDFSVDEMKKFFHQSILTMTDTFEQSTGDTETAEGIRAFCEDLGERLGVINSR